jgi:hypothetical protein
MTPLDNLIKLLDSLSYEPSSGTEKDVFLCNCAKEQVADEREIIIYEVLNIVERSMESSYEARNFSDIITHLIDTLRLKLIYNDRDFLKITGLRLNKGTCKLENRFPDLSPLGTYSDWLSMQEAGHALFDTKPTKADPSIGWRYYYYVWLTGANDDEVVYPSIMQARLSWAEGAELAPYWYWYDQAIDTDRAYPRQSPLRFSEQIFEYVSNFVQKTNSFCANQKDLRGDEVGLILELQHDNIEDFIEETITSGRHPTSSKPLVKFRWTGKLHGETISEYEINRRILNGEFGITDVFPDGDVRIYHKTEVPKPGGGTFKPGQFTGIRSVGAELDRT